MSFGTVFSLAKSALFRSFGWQRVSPRLDNSSAILAGEKGRQGRDGIHSVADPSQGSKQTDWFSQHCSLRQLAVLVCGEREVRVGNVSLILAMTRARPVGVEGGDGDVGSTDEREECHGAHEGDNEAFHRRMSCPL